MLRPLVALVPSRAVSRMAATGGTRPERSAGSNAENTVTSRPTTMVRMIVRGSNVSAGRRQIEPERGEGLPEAEGQHHAEAEAEERADQADHHGLDQQRPVTCAGWRRWPATARSPAGVAPR